MIKLGSFFPRRVTRLQPAADSGESNEQIERGTAGVQRKYLLERGVGNVLDQESAARGR